MYNDGITDLDAGKVVTTRGAQYDLKIWLGDRPIYEYQDTTFVRNTQMKSKAGMCRGNPYRHAE